MVLGQGGLNRGAHVDKTKVFVIKFLLFVLFLCYDWFLLRHIFSFAQSTMISTNEGLLGLATGILYDFLDIWFLHYIKDYEALILS